MFLAPRGAAACCKPARFCAAKALSPLEHQRKRRSFDRLFCIFENPGHLAISAVAAHGGEPIAFKSQLFARSAPKAGVRIPAGAPKKKDFRHKTGVSFFFLVFLRGDSNPERVGAFKKHAGGMFLAPRGAAACCKPARFCAAKALSPLEHQRKRRSNDRLFLLYREPRAHSDIGGVPAVCY